MQKQPTDPFGIVGQVLDAQFRVDRLVGEGGFSAVYRGFHLGLQEPIAIKCLKLPPTLSPPLVDQFEKRFRDESRILYKLSQGNLNIVRSMASGTWQSPTGFVVPFMILEWLEGRSLANEFTIRRTVGNQGRSLEDVLKLFGPAADGLGYAHSQGVVHRDLNPGNLFLSSTPQGIRMKVLDFGVAKILDDSTVNIGPRIQTVGQIRIFAPAYGAPEQFDDGIGKVGAASDVYAFALILLEALRDRSVNDGAHLGEFAQKAVDRAHRPTPRSLGLDVSDEVEQIFARATKLDPRERWQSAGELWQALAIARSAESIERHAQAAMETPALGMPSTSRATKTGMGPPKGRNDKTLPIHSARPDLPFLTQPGSAASTSRAADPHPQDVPRAPASNPSTTEKQGMDKTRMGVPDMRMDESEDEPTRVAASNLDALRNLPAPGPHSGSPGHPLPAAGEPSSHRSPESHQGGTQPPPPHPGAGPHAGTFMMGGAAPAGFGPLPPPPAPPRRPAGALNQTMPLAGPHPLGLPSAQGGGGPLPAAGAPPQHGGYPPSQPLQHGHGAPPPSGSHSHAGHAHLQGGVQGMPGHGPQNPHPHMMPPQGLHPHLQQPHNLADSVALAPGAAAGAPKSSNPLLFIGIGLGALALLGIMGIAIHFASGSKEAGTPSGSASVASPTTPAPSASASAPPATTDPAPSAEPAPTTATADTTSPSDDTPVPPPPTTATAAATATVAPTASPTPTPTPTVTPTPTPTVTPTPTPTVTPTPTPTAAVKDAGAAVDPNAFNESLARSRLSQANSVLVFCKRDGWVNGPGTASVTFNTDGSVASVTMNPPYAGTPAGDCVAGQFKRAKTNPYQGAQRTLVHSFDVPK